MNNKDGTLIVAGDRQVTFAVPAGMTPALTGTLSIDGKDHAMKDLRTIAGTGAVAAPIASIADWGVAVFRPAATRIDVRVAFEMRRRVGGTKGNEQRQPLGAVIGRTGSIRKQTQ